MHILPGRPQGAVVGQGWARRGPEPTPSAHVPWRRREDTTSSLQQSQGAGLRGRALALGPFLPGVGSGMLDRRQPPWGDGTATFLGLLRWRR